MSSRKRIVGFFSLLLAVGLTVTACGGQGTSADKGHGNSAVEEITGDSDKVLKAAYQYNPSSLDPHTQAGSYSPVALEMIFDTLIRVQPDGTLAPGLAEAWNFSEDNKQLILEVRQGVQFTDGTALDAETVKVNLDRARGVGFDKSAMSGDLRSIEDVSVDGNNVVIDLKEGEGGALPAILSDRAGMIASQKSLDDPQFDQNPAGAGPYKLASFDAGSHLNVERWDGYWDKETARNAGVELSFVKDSSARLRGLQSGQYDWVTVDPVQIADAEMSKLNVVTGSTYSYNRIALNRSREWFANPLVREALTHAIDRDALVQGLLFGHGAAAYQPFPDGFWGAAPNNKPAAYDPARAKELLAEAGYPNGFTFEAVCASSPAATQVAEAVAGQLAEVGIKVKIRPVDKSTVTFYSNKESDAWIGPWGGRADPALTLSLQFTKGKLQNPGGTASDSIEKAAAEALKPGAQEARESTVQAFTQQVLDEHLDTFLFFENLTQVHSDEVLGVKTWVTDKPSFRNVIKK